MTDQSERKLSPAAARNMGFNRESWCAVEMKKEQSWDRKVRKHHPQQFSSSVFDKHQPGYEPRCNFRVDAPTHRERRHHPDQYTCQMKI
ncbi:protein SPATA45 homolog [Pecten maximus]|uniref:protein SPATA45 homolog n=1 Tax=Pecten maximus TaxID=6579 RepID=UPI00145848A0|nr:protein SPATA45 homolog [Pecten maximus]